MLAIKFQRVGKKHQPSYRIVVAEKRSKLGGPPVEQVGTYSPSTKNASLEKERILYWLKVGAKPTVSIHNLLVRQGVLSAPKVAVKMKRPEVAREVAAGAPAAEAMPQAAPEAEEQSVQVTPETATQ